MRFVTSASVQRGFVYMGDAQLFPMPKQPGTSTQENVVVKDFSCLLVVTMPQNFISMTIICAKHWLQLVFRIIFLYLTFALDYNKELS